MCKFALTTVSLLLFLVTSPARADFTLSFSSNDIGVSSVFNNVTFFSFDIVVGGTITPGATFSNPNLVSVDYRINGSLPQSTPSGFPAFQLVRSINGADFYNLSPEAELEFSVSSTADLSDGLQMNELDGSGTVFSFNAREFNQNPGRYHPPIFTLDDIGVGRLVNANNQSTFPNPDPPVGSGQLVDVEIADEYDVMLSFSPNLTIATSAVPEPSSGALLLGAFGAASVVRRRRPR